LARVGTRGAGLSKDIALSVKNKLTHLGANVSDDLARLSGKVEDAFAYADGAVSKNIGKHNARVYQSNGGNWDEVASGILGGSGVGRKAAAEFSDDASQALAKHGDEVSQALMDKITRMDGFEHLTFAEKKLVLNFEENFIGLSKSANASKGSKTYEEWKIYKRDNIPIESKFRKEMIEKEKILECKIQGLIDFLNNRRK
jgi:PAAR repeat protein